MDRDFPDFVSQRDGNVFRVMVCNARDEPFPLQHVTEYPDGSSLAKASDGVYVCGGSAFLDKKGLCWNWAVDAKHAADIARKAVGR